MKDLLGERMESIHMAHFTPHQLSLPFCCLVLIPYIFSWHSDLTLLPLFFMLLGNSAQTVTLSQPSLPRHT